MSRTVSVLLHASPYPSGCPDSSAWDSLCWTCISERRHWIGPHRGLCGRWMYTGHILALHTFRSKTESPRQCAPYTLCPSQSLCQICCDFSLPKIVWRVEDLRWIRYYLNVCIGMFSNFILITLQPRVCTLYYSICISYYMYMYVNLRVVQHYIFMPILGWLH